MKAYMYILKCKDKSYYVGSTDNLTLRVEEHNAGEGCSYTKERLPVQLVYYEECFNIKDAFNREQQVKGWGRKKKEALIKGDMNSLRLLSKKALVKGPFDKLRDPMAP
ncbi:MAG: GIY-YIG nuclease family protein [Treponema sp.]|nr:GIY-YIG nuclease family protein [Treponema sp.]MBR4790820.1 GIY-YIG nuclease family protein [Treponema sp.]